MKLLPIANHDEAREFRHHPLVAVDMGFSGTSKSCGVACVTSDSDLHEEHHHFASAAGMVAGFFRQHGEGVLILEAPLSAAFDAEGDPCARGGLERVGKPRWWNLRAGASMALAALYFCRRLHDVIIEDTNIHLVEGFVVGDQSGSHAVVAARLARAFRGEPEGEWHTVECAGVKISIAEWFGQPRGNACPAILQPQAV